MNREQNCRMPVMCALKSTIFIQLLFGVRCHKCTTDSDCTWLTGLPPPRQAMPGVRDFVTAKDVMGSNDSILMSEFVPMFKPAGLNDKMLETQQVCTYIHTYLCTHLNISMTSLRTYMRPT